MTLRPSDILAEPCPLCGAPPGRSCRDGTHFDVLWAHTARAAASVDPHKATPDDDTARAAAVVR